MARATTAIAMTRQSLDTVLKNRDGKKRIRMPTILSLILAVAGTVGFLATFYFVILSVFGLRNRKSKPVLEVLPGGSPGTIAVAVRWNASVYAIQIWRIRMRFFSPARLVKDAQFSVTFESPQKKSFLAPIELPPVFRELVESNNQTNRAVIAVEGRGVENFVLSKDFRLPKFQKIYHAKESKRMAGETKAPLMKEDPPSIASLDHSELIVHRERLKVLVAQAKAKPVSPKPAVAPEAATRTQS